MSGGSGTGTPVIPPVVPSSGSAQDYILRAFRRCGAMRPGYTPPAELLAEGLAEWTTMFDSWATERTMGYSVPQYVYPVTGAGSQSDGNGYQVGPTALDWVGPRPEVIIRANLKMNSVGLYPVYVPLKSITAEQWASLSIRQMPGINVTSIFYYDPQWPNGVFNVFPPLTGNSIELFTSQELAAPATLATFYSGPPGYVDAVVKSLTVRLWPLCTKNMMANKLPYAVLFAAAENACNKVKAINRPIPTLVNDFGNNNKMAGYYDSFVSKTGLPT